MNSVVENSNSTVKSTDSSLSVKDFITSNYKPGEKIPGEMELIDILRVSRYAVLKGLTELVAEGVVERRRGSGSFMAKRSSGINSRSVAFVANEFDSHMNVEIMRGVDDYLRKRGMHLTLMNSGYDKSRDSINLRKVRSERFGGVLAILDPDEESLAAAREIVESGIPFVQIDRHFDEVEAPSVEADHESGAYEAVSHLIALGHTRIGHITLPDPEHCPLSSVTQRFNGFRKALEDHGLKVIPEYVESIKILDSHGCAPQSVSDFIGYEPTHKLISMSEPPTALFLLHDHIAPGVYKAIVNQGLSVPNDISVVGFNDDIIASCIYPPLTTFKQPYRDIGVKAAGMLETLMEGERITCDRVIISGELSIRESVKRIVPVI